MKTKIGAWGAGKTPVAMMFRVAGLRLTGRSDVGRAIEMQMRWELKLAREAGLLRAIESLAGRNPGQWDAKSSAIVSRWRGADGIAITSVFQVPDRKMLDVTHGATPVLRIDAELNDATGNDSVWFLPGAWMQRLTAAAAGMADNLQPKTGEADMVESVVMAPKKAYG